MMGADVISEPFAVINCDDFYGRDSFQVMGKFLSALPENSKNVYSMVGFRVEIRSARAVRYLVVSAVQMLTTC